MPGGINGVELAVRARQIRPDIKVLLTSGYTHGALAAHNVPTDLPLLAKPYRVEQLSAQFTTARSSRVTGLRSLPAEKTGRRPPGHPAIER
jgi:DNA-binding LytR/AlgR family response regulator